MLSSTGRHPGEGYGRHRRCRHTPLSPAERLIRSLNHAWLANDFDAILACYHPNVILLPPDAGDPIVGREAVVASYRAFSKQAKLTSFEVAELLSYEIDDLCAVHMRFDVKYRLDDADFEESGMEVYWLDAAPSIIWRHQMVL